MLLCFIVLPWVQSFWQDDVIGDANISEFINVMLGADSDNQSQASDQPRWLEPM